MNVASVIQGVVEGYLAVGAVFLVPFLVVGVSRLDPQVANSPVLFRGVLAPGVVLLWPLLAWRWAAGRRQPPEERTAHRCRKTGKGRL